MANVYSRYNVVVFDDGSIRTDDLPSDGSDLSSGGEDEGESESDQDAEKIEEVEQLVVEVTMHEYLIKIHCRI